MAGVYCPTCEAGVEAAAKFCLSCVHDLTINGPITATGHDLNQLKEVIRVRDDLSMAEKFDMIAKIEDGANPIVLGIAAPAEGEDVDLSDAFAMEVNDTSASSIFSNHEWGNSPAANAAVRAVVRGTNGWDLIQAGKLDLKEGLFREAMDNGMEASTHIHDVASGEHEGIDPESMRAIPVLKPPKRSFCPKCGSDIHANTMLQWKKWSEASGVALTIQLEAAMRSSLMHLSNTYRDKIQDLEDQLSDAKKAVEKAREEAEEAAEKASKEPKPEKKDTKKSGKGAAATKAAPKKSKPASVKPKSGGLFGAKKPKKTYEGEPGGKADWFLEEALDTVYDPHGTGKPIKAAMILARSSEGNVRVRDVIRTYAVEGEEGVSELAWTSPITKYLIEAYDAC